MDIKCRFISGKNWAVTTDDHMIDGFLVPNGFPWNGASIPMWLVSPLFVSSYHRTVRRASLLHDFLYFLGADRKMADKQFAKNCREDGANTVQVWAMYWALRLFGWAAYNKMKRNR